MGASGERRLLLECENCKDWITEQCSTEHNGINYSWAFQGLAVVNRRIVLSCQFTLLTFYTFRLFLLWWYLQTKWRLGVRARSLQMCVIIQRSFGYVYVLQWPVQLCLCCADELLTLWQRGQITGTRLYCVLCSLSVPRVPQVEGHFFPETTKPKPPDDPAGCQSPTRCLEEVFRECLLKTTHPHV